MTATDQALKNGRKMVEAEAFASRKETQGKNGPPCLILNSDDLGIGP